MIETRKTGIDCMGDVPWGTHVCQFYATSRELADTLVPYFATGLRQDEFCIWITGDPLGVEEAKTELRTVVPSLDRYFEIGQIEILDYRDWYLKGGRFDAGRVLDQWAEKEKQAIDRGYQGLRASDDTAWIDKKDWQDFIAYEAEVNRQCRQHHMIGLCTYSTDSRGADAVLEIVRNHQRTLARIGGQWEMVDSPNLKITEDELRRLNEHLEERIKETTTQLEAANTVLDARLRIENSLSAQLQRLSARLLQLQDEERRRIATQLLDVTAQDLCVIALTLAGLQRQERIPSVKTALAECRRLCDENLKGIRTLCGGLYPELLDRFGLVFALDSYLKSFVKRNGIDVGFEVSPGMERLPLNIETKLFWIAEEALSNIVRHSGSSTAMVRLERHKDFVIFLIEDFGRGMPAAVMAAISGGAGELGVGLLGMRERLRIINGSLEIQSDNHGTTVIARVPLSQ